MKIFFAYRLKAGLQNRTPMTPILQIITDRIGENQLNLRYLCSIRF